MSNKNPPVIPLPTPEPWKSPADLIARPRDENYGRFNPRGNPPNYTRIFDAHRYAWLRGSQLFSVGTTSAMVIDQPTGFRNMLMLRNASATANIYVEFGSDASTTQTVLRLKPDQVVLLDTVVPQDAIYAIADAASASLAVMQSQYSP